MAPFWPQLTPTEILFTQDSTSPHLHHIEDSFCMRKSYEDPVKKIGQFHRLFLQDMELPSRT